MQYKKEIITLLIPLVLTILTQNPFETTRLRKNFNPDTNVMNSYLIPVKYVIEIEYLGGKIDTIFVSYTHVPSMRDITFCPNEWSYGCNEVPNFSSTSKKEFGDKIYLGVKSIKTLGIYNPL